MKLTTEEKAKRLEQRRQARKEQIKADRIEAEKNQQPVKEIVFNIEWKKSRMWGNNPHLEAKIVYKDCPDINIGNFEKKFASCSGCGYDKESTVIADIFNRCLKYKLYQSKIFKKDNKPYGIQLDLKYYEGGIGTNCYTTISEFIGGKFEHIASGKTFDVYKYTDLS